ncbi:MULTISPECIES: MocR-like pyridoxine biosynthesis transcription factor PdxR [Streptomyces]|uniref:GntR family transcriptional regulator n=2 Tax=Streptomyces TaxID=1883 RepID=A0A2U9PCA7_STRAS|nr:PLP-dependent aminotransferase family protein [Streptomyces actuosus]AWT46558.1 GntR family transcriptional regulator [Streptomyces actuosus]MBM4823269.1 PLP-dependent aminotransferase family protein [Streptomyces actuosus]
MPQDRPGPAWSTLLDLDGQPAGPLHRRLGSALRSAVVTGRIAPGSALPPSRVLAADLGCSRWVITEAYAQLVTEGYVEARSGSATRVRAGAVSVPGPARTGPEPSRPPEFDMLPGVPDLRAFPRKRWADAVRAATSSMSSADLGLPDWPGHPRLRQRLAAYLVRGRGAVAAAENVVVCDGTLDGAVRLCRALRRAGHTRVAVEDPGWSRLPAALTAVGLTPVPVPVDGDGLRVDRLRALPEVRAVVVAPAHQFPTGTVLSPARRAELLRWAREADGLVLEDDYDAEFRHERRPIGTVQGMDPSRVVLMGSLSKTLSPALRLGWLAAPPRWTEALRAEEAATTPPPVIDQLAFAEFLDAGWYDRHLRASRLRYRRRRDLLLRELAAALPGLEVSGAAAGFHLLLHLPECSAERVVRRAARRGLRLAGLDRYRAEPAGGSPALVLGYGNLSDAAVPEAVHRLAACVRAECGG